MSVLKNNQKITPFLWFDDHAEQAISYYVSVFPRSSIGSMRYWGEGDPFPKGNVQSAVFVLDGLTFYAFDAGPQFQFTEAISFFVSCVDQKEVDYYWERLSDGGSEAQCGWVKDKFGLSWQVVPDYLSSKMSDGDPAKVQQMMGALMGMKKIDIARLEEAYNT